VINWSDKIVNKNPFLCLKKIMFDEKPIFISRLN